MNMIKIMLCSDTGKEQIPVMAHAVPREGEQVEFYNRKRFVTLGTVQKVRHQVMTSVDDGVPESSVYNILVILNLDSSAF